MIKSQCKFAGYAGLVIGLLVLQLTGCGKGESQSMEGMPPPQQVTVIELQPRQLPARFEYVGRLEASREIEIRPPPGRKPVWQPLSRAAGFSCVQSTPNLHWSIASLPAARKACD